MEVKWKRTSEVWPQPRVPFKEIRELHRQFDFGVNTAKDGSYRSLQLAGYPPPDVSPPTCPMTISKCHNHPVMTSLHSHPHRDVPLVKRKPLLWPQTKMAAAMRICPKSDQPVFPWGLFCPSGWGSLLIFDDMPEGGCLRYLGKVPAQRERKRPTCKGGAERGIL